MSSPQTPPHFIHLPTADLAQAINPSALGVICFSETAPTSQQPDLPQLTLTTNVLQGRNFASELWLTNTDSPQLSLQHFKDIEYRIHAEYLFGVIRLPEVASNEVSGLHFATQQAYEQIFALMTELDYRYIYRFWNYMADINVMTHGLERYRQFNAGRKDAFAAHASLLGDQYPAACALGLAQGHLSIAFLIGRNNKPIAIENPRQISAYEYPDQYGPRTPSFARATLLRTDETATLFISGTASITGHQTQHVGDVAAQTLETMLNLQTLIDEANLQLGKNTLQIGSVFFRVYVRHAPDVAIIEQTMQSYLNQPAPLNATFIQADICRRDLLLEIEATVQGRLG